MSESILVVDDDAGLRQLMQWALEDGGYPVETAADGEQAVARIRQAPPRLLVLDMTLPGIDGFGVAKVLKAIARDVPILVVTADGGAEAKAARVGAFSFLRKPFLMEELLARVRKALLRP